MAPARKTNVDSTPDVTPDVDEDTDFTGDYTVDETTDNATVEGGTSTPGSNASPSSSTVEEDDADYVYIPVGGEFRRVRKSQIWSGGGEPTSVVTPVEGENDEFYVHLANGDVDRVKRKELPPNAGASHPNGFLTKDRKVHEVIGVYPVEADSAE